MIITHSLKTTLSILCTVSFLSGCIATQKVKIDDGNKSSREVIKNVEPLPPSQLTSRESPPPIVQVSNGEQLPSRKKRQSNTQLQSKKQLQLMYISYLKKEGYLPEIDYDGDVKFKKEGNIYFIDVKAQQKDPQYFRIIHFIGRIKNDIERQEVLVAEDHVNSTIKVVKFYTLKDTAWAAVEIFISNREDFKDIFSRIISVLSGGRESFINKIKEIKRQKI
jgi:hypothetical protein